MAHIHTVHRFVGICVLFVTRFVRFRGDKAIGNHFCPLDMRGSDSGVSAWFAYSFVWVGQKLYQVVRAASLLGAGQATRCLAHAVQSSVRLWIRCTPLRGRKTFRPTWKVGGNSRGTTATGSPVCPRDNTEFHNGTTGRQEKQGAQPAASFVHPCGPEA